MNRYSNRIEFVPGDTTEHIDFDNVRMRRSQINRFKEVNYLLQDQISLPKQKLNINRVKAKDLRKQFRKPHSTFIMRKRLIEYRYLHYGSGVQ